MKKNGKTEAPKMQQTALTALREAKGLVESDAFDALIVIGVGENQMTYRKICASNENKAKMCAVIAAECEMLRNSALLIYKESQDEIRKVAMEAFKAQQEEPRA